MWFVLSMCLWPTTLRQETQRPLMRCWPPLWQPPSSKLLISTPAINFSRCVVCLFVTFVSTQFLDQSSCSNITEQQVAYLPMKSYPHNRKYRRHVNSRPEQYKRASALLTIALTTAKRTILMSWKSRNTTHVTRWNNLLMGYISLSKTLQQNLTPSG